MLADPSWWCQRAPGARRILRTPVATIHLTCWRDIPVLVTAREGEDQVSLPLDPGFQDLVDRVAMLEGLAESEAYLAEWRVEPAMEHPGGAEAAAATVAAELAAGLDAWRARYLPAERRPDPA